MNSENGQILIKPVAILDADFTMFVWAENSNARYIKSANSFNVSNDTELGLNKTWGIHSKSKIVERECLFWALKWLSVALTNEIDDEGLYAKQISWLV